MASNLERIKALQKQKEQAKAEIVAEATVAKVEESFAAKAIDIVHKCGHKVNLASLCPPCAIHKSKEKNRKNKAKWLAKKQSPGRLPDGSVFNVSYSEESTSWTGTLTIKDGPIFETTQSGVFTLLSRLDFLYRSWLKRQEST